MASRVNTRFVIILIVGVIAMLGMLVLAYSIAIKSASDLAKRGDQLMAQGEYKQAERAYSKAVNKDATNIENLDKWIDALELLVPETETEYRDKYNGSYIGAVRKKAMVLRHDVDAHEQFITIRFEMLDAAYSRGLADVVIDDTNGSLAFFSNDSEEVQDWERLKRYRGLAIVKIAKKGGLLESDQISLAIDDLQRSSAADPDDAKSVIGLMNLHSFVTNRDAPEDDTAARVTTLEENIQTASDYIAQHPNSTEMMIQKMLLNVDYSRRQIIETTEGIERAHALQASLDSFKGQLDTLSGNLLANNGERLNIETAILFSMLENAINPDAKMARTRQMIDYLIDSQKDNPELLWIAGRVAVTAGDIDEALGWYDQIGDLETKPISFQGLRQYSIKREALLAQARIRVDQAQSLPNDAAQSEIDAALQTAKESRDLFAGSVNADNLALILLDGKIERINENLEEALRLFRKYNEQTRRESAPGLWEEGITASQLGQYGIARQALTEMIPLEGSTRRISAMMTLAQINERLKDYSAAAELYKQILDVNPTMTIVQDALDNVNKLINPELNDDPVLAAIYRSRQMRLGSATEPGDYASAIQFLRESVEELDYEPRIARELSAILFDRGDVEGSKQTLVKSLERNPDEEWLAKTIKALDSNDPIASRIAMIRQAEGDMTEKLLTIAEIAIVNERRDVLDQTIIELDKIAPDHKGVVELHFVNALKYGDVEVAKEIAARPGLSAVDALSFNARISVTQGDLPKAIELLQQAVATGSADAATYRILANLQNDVGQLENSIQSFEKSLEINPDNKQVISEYIRALAKAAHYEEALNTARRLQRFGSTDTAFLNLWLNLEAIYGGQQGLDFAILQRSKMLELNPADLENKSQLARLYTITKEWDNARLLIDELRAEQDHISLVELDATWYADQGTYKNRDGLLYAKEVFSQYVQGLEAPVGPQAFIANAEFMLNRGRPDLAVIAAKEAVKAQSTDTMLGSKLLGNLYMRINNYSGAAEVYQDVLDQEGADANFDIHLRLIGTYTKLQRYEEAQAIFDNVPEEMKNSMVALIQASDIARGLGDAAKASEILDKAVALYSTDSYVYIKRAEYMIGDETLLNDLLSDLARAIDLQANDWRAYRVRAAGYFAVGRREDALKDLKATIRLNPNLDKSIFAILNELLSIPGRESEALDVAREVISRRPDDATLMARMGGLFASRQQWDHASELFGYAWAKRHAISDGAVYIDALVRQSPPDAQRANDVINEIEKMIGNINKSPGLLAAQSLVLQARGRDDFAQQQITKAFDLSAGKDSDLIQWAGNLTRYFETQPVSAHIEYLEAIKRRNADTNVHAWLDLFIAQRQTQATEIDPAAYQTLERLEDYAMNPAIQIRAYQLLGSTQYAQDKFEEAAATWEAGLALFPNDWELNNNLAYVLSTELGQHEKALSFGLAAIDRNIARSEAYETMAGIYLRLNKYDEAEQMINTGSNYIKTIPARVSMVLTSGRLHFARGRLLEARSRLNDAHSVLRSSSTAYPSLQEDIDAFAKEINSADD